MSIQEINQQQCVIPRLDRGIQEALKTLVSRLRGNDGIWSFVLGRFGNLGENTGLFLSIVFLAWPSPASAHLVTTGMGPVYDGIGHLLLTPEDLIPSVALALYAGLRGAVSGRRIMFLLPLGWFIGGIAGSAANFMPSFPISAVSFLVLGALVAADLRMPSAAVTALAIILGLVHGFLNGAALKEGAGTLGLLGIVIMLFIIVALASAVVVSLEKPWTRIAARVAGSWIFASGLLMIGWLIREAK